MAKSSDTCLRHSAHEISPLALFSSISSSLATFRCTRRGSVGIAGVDLVVVVDVAGGAGVGDGKRQAERKVEL